MIRGRVAVIDKSWVVRIGLHELLAEEGYDVLATADAADAKTLSPFRPHVVLVDADQLTGDKALLEAVAIAPTMILMGVEPPHGIHCDRFLRKPIAIDELFAAVANAVNQSRDRH